MTEIKFPKEWLLNIKNIDQLASLVSVSTINLLKIEKKIPVFYYEKTISKGNKERVLFVPALELKKVQRKILNNILNFKFPFYTHGGISGRSIITNARMHLSQKWVMCLDIKDFFPSIHYKKIYKNFILLNCSSRVSKLLTHLTTYKYQLPQGTPTSPAIANIILYNLDKRIFGLCRMKNLKYSRYFDDIAISGSSNPKSILKKCESIIYQEGFKINKKPEKLRTMPSEDKQIVNGLIVNGPELQPSPEEIQKIHTLLNQLVSKDFSIFLNKEPIKVKKELEGHIAFLKSVNLSIAKKFKQKFNKISWSSFCN